MPYYIVEVIILSNFDNAVENLRTAIRFPTISYKDRSKIDKEVFLAYHEFLKATYPNVFSYTVETVEELNLLITIPGTDSSLKPVLLISHIDVVTIGNETDWTAPAFSADIIDGYIYGRGTLDMKGHMIAKLEALENLLSSGKLPKRGIYIALGHDEELMEQENSGAKKISMLLESRGITFDFAIDEGGLPGFNGEYLGVDKKIALIGICERGYVDVEITANDKGGHSSMPPKNTALGKLAKYITKLENDPLKPFWSTPATGFIDAVADSSTGIKKFAMKHRKLLGGFVLKEFSKYQRSNALVSSTCACTMANASLAPNVLPRSATLTVNMRVAPEDTADNLLSYLKSHADDDMEIKLLTKIEASPVASTTSSAYKQLEKSVLEIFDNTISAPYPVLFGTDSRHYYNICSDMYHFTPFECFAKDSSLLHAIDERIEIASFTKGIEFFINFFDSSIF